MAESLVRWERARTAIEVVSPVDVVKVPVLLTNLLVVYPHNIHRGLDLVSELEDITQAYLPIVSKQFAGVTPVPLGDTPERTYYRPFGRSLKKVIQAAAQVGAQVHHWEAVLRSAKNGMIDLADIMFKTTLPLYLLPSGESELVTNNYPPRLEEIAANKPKRTRLKKYIKQIRGSDFEDFYKDGMFPMDVRAVDGCKVQMGSVGLDEETISACLESWSQINALQENIYAVAAFSLTGGPISDQIREIVAHEKNITNEREFARILFEGGVAEETIKTTLELVRQETDRIHKGDPNSTMLLAIHRHTANLKSMFTLMKDFEKLHNSTHLK